MTTTRDFSFVVLLVGPGMFDVSYWVMQVKDSVLRPGDNSIRDAPFQDLQLKVWAIEVCSMNVIYYERDASRGLRAPHRLPLSCESVRMNASRVALCVPLP